MTSSKWTSLLILAAMFVVGAFTGAGVLYRFAPRPPPPPHLRPPGLPPELGLSPEQDQKTRAIIDKHGPEIDAIVRATFPQVRAVGDQVKREIREVLTPEQRAKLDEIEARHGGPPMPFPPPPR